ncbi:MAG: hypothetical protein Q8N15_05000, partial [Bacillota bacterium]|nr:hypothetical protein [Bacillota bacterium]
YVALTRAKERVFITNAQQRLMYGHYQDNPDSEFLSEIGEELVDHQGLAKPKIKADFGFPKPEPRANEYRPAPPAASAYVPSGVRFAIGDKVKHAVFGEGIIVMIDADKATIAFKAPVGIKILMKDHPSIQKA